jgi:hypothetical protein
VPLKPPTPEGGTLRRLDTQREPDDLTEFDVAPGELAVGLIGRVVPVPALARAERDGMYELLRRYFAGVRRSGFEADLAEKEWAILLADRGSGALEGFSTLMRLRVVVDGAPVTAFFSGDTIVARERWHESALPRLWSRHVFALAGAETASRVYWFLISSGYRTYRFLPVFFREFYPTWVRPTPPEAQRVLQTLGRTKFGAGYDPRTGVVRLPEAAALRPGIAEITPQRLRDPHVAFFVGANPGHARGDELACLAELTPANLTRAARRVLGPAGGRAPR